MAHTSKPAHAPSRRHRGFILPALGILLALVVLAGAAVAAYVVFRVLPNVPALDAVTDYRPKIPLRIYSADNVLIGEFGEEHRDFVPIDKIPPLMKKSLLAIEDARFYEHGAIDYRRMLGAVGANLRGGFGSGGASTITMQVARNFFLSREKRLSRKINEIALAYKIEAALSKDEILELYMNQIYLGQRAYGFSSAARTYFGKPLDKLTVAEMAMLAGLPQNPSRHNPAVNPKKARERQHQVLGRMHALNYISDAEYEQAMSEPLRVNTRGQEFDSHAEYVAELARQVVYNQFKDEAYTKGIKVTTTILKNEQDAAYASVRRNVIAYDQRHGWRGPEGRIDLPSDPVEREDAINDALAKRPVSDGLLPAVVLSTASKSIKVETIDGDVVELSGSGLKFAQAGLSSNAKDTLRLSPGAIIRVAKDAKDNWSVTQVPQVAAAFVAIDADTGAYHALVGGFDYNFQKFNHVTQAWRQPGSGMKPFIYSAAIEKGYSPATKILDAPLDMAGEDAGKTWSPQNDDFKWDGPITMRRALAESKNVPSVRLLRAVTVPFAHDFLGHFGFDLARQPKNYTLALGTGAVTPLQMAGAYAVFANGGYQVQPYLIAKIEDADGKVLQEVKPPARTEEQRVLDPRNAFVTDSMLRDVARFGTGAAATKALGRGDVAGKTGTTSDAVDGWFSGYAGNVVAVAWMGYDDPRSLGGREFGATLALPIWIDYMKVAVAKRPETVRAEPEGLVRENDDWVYPEYADAQTFSGIDLEQQPLDPNAPPADGTAPPGAPGAPPAPGTPPPQPAQPVNSLF
nr:PBP1A family penicillin-binding protein [uncultured Massilia sp.]